MNNWELLERVKFFYDVRDRPEHPKLVEQARQLIELQHSKMPTLDKVLVLLADDENDPLFVPAIEYYLNFCSGMSNSELYDYARYLMQTFGMNPKRRYVPIPSQ